MKAIRHVFFWFVDWFARYRGRCACGVRLLICTPDYGHPNYRQCMSCHRCYHIYDNQQWENCWWKQLPDGSWAQRTEEEGRIWYNEQHGIEDDEDDIS